MSALRDLVLEYLDRLEADQKAPAELQTFARASADLVRAMFHDDEAPS